MSGVVRVVYNCQLLILVLISLRKEGFFFFPKYNNKCHLFFLVNYEPSLAPTSSNNIKKMSKRQLCFLNVNKTSTGSVGTKLLVTLDIVFWAVWNKVVGVSMWSN